MPFIVGIEGGYGSGKTLTSAIKAHQWAGATQAQIISNYKLRDAMLFEDYTDWYRVAHLHGTIIIFDESQKDWDGRRFSGDSQVDKTHIMNYVRKMNSIFVFVLPDFSDVDARVRKMCEILIHVERKRDGSMENKIFDYTDKRYGENGRLIKREFLSFAKQKEIFALNLYNTNQMVMSFPMPSKEEKDFFFKRLDRIHNEAVKREYPDRQDIAVRMKDDLNIEQLYNPDYLEEVAAVGNDSEPVFVPSSGKGKERREDSQRGDKLIFV